MRDGTEPGPPAGSHDTRRIVLFLAALVLVGGPMTGFVWHELSEAMMGRPHGKALAVALALALATLLLLRHFGRALTTGRPTERRASGSKTHD